MDNRLIQLFDQYTHSQIGRRVFMSRLIGITGSLVAANKVLEKLQNRYEIAETVSEEGETWDSAWVTFGDAPIKAYLVTPKAEKCPAVVVIHENRGLNPYIQDVARQLGKAGFLACAVDGLSRLGGTPQDEDKAREMIRQLEPEQTRQDNEAALSFLANHPRSNGKVGCVGFCWGGAMANQLAVHAKDLQAAVSFYGRQASAEDVQKIDVPLMLHYGGLDERINAGIPAFEEALKSHNVDHHIFIYENAHHAFHNHTNQARHNPEAAELAWKRTLDFFQKHLK